MTHEYARLALAIFDGAAGLVIVVALLTERGLSFPRWHRLFVSIGAAGLLAQSALIVARLNGYSVAELWWSWAAKDICIGGLALTYAIIAFRRGRSGA